MTDNITCIFFVIFFLESGHEFTSEMQKGHSNKNTDIPEQISFCPVNTDTPLCSCCFCNLLHQIYLIDIIVFITSMLLPSKTN